MAGTVLSPVRGRAHGRLRGILLLACLALVAAACGGSPSPGADGGTDVTIGDGRVDGSGDGGPGGGGVPGGGVPGGGPGGGGNGGPGGGQATSTTKPSSGGPATTAARPTTTKPPGGSRTAAPPQAPESGARQGPGAFARTILRPEPATRVLVDVLVHQGAAPRQATLDHLRQVLVDATGGKEVTIGAPVLVPAGDGTADDEEIRLLADRYGSPQSSGRAVLHLLFLHGRYVPEDGVLGVAVRGDTAAVFSDAVNDAATPLVGAGVIEDAVTTHELGHLLGLVDIVLKSGREDPQYPGHSRNRQSVMYWAVDDRLVAQAIGGPPPRNFDSADRADLAAIRNGA